MKTLYLECNMGAAGDMLTAALLELHPQPENFLARLNRLGLPGVAVSAQKTAKCGVAGTHVSVTVNGEEEQSLDVPREGLHWHIPESADHEHRHDEGQGHDDSHGHEHAHKHEHEHEEQQDHDHGHHHSHAGLHEIETLVEGLDIPPAVRANVLAVYGLIAQAESAAHNCPVAEVHFHEVGALDAVADVTAVCWLLQELHPEKIVASPVHVGSGQVRCAHGILPVPTPATAYLLRGIPTYGGAIQGELCTPTGAALLRHFATAFGPQPEMRVEQIGYGMGQKDFPQANCLRAMLGEGGSEGFDVAELRCNLDDMTPEALAFAAEELFAAGALDVYTVPITMKKGRAAALLVCLCKEEQRREMVRLLFLHTTTLGIREVRCGRYTLSRSERTVKSDYGPVRVKVASGWGVEREKPEYEDVAALARERGLSLRQVCKSLKEEE